jgi:hypothetical protein
MTKKKNPKLDPCPFCKSKRLRFINDGADWNKGVECRGCGMNVYFFKDDGWNVSTGTLGKGLEDKAAIAERWNSRKL